VTDFVALATFQDAEGICARRECIYPRDSPAVIIYPEFFVERGTPVGEWPEWARPRMVEAVESAMGPNLRIVQIGDRLHADDPMVLERPEKFQPVEA
jgi:hypothetical protein